jgi:hypothetical protein
MENNHSDQDIGEYYHHVLQPYLAIPTDDSLEPEIGENARQPLSYRNSNPSAFRISRKPIPQIRIESPRQKSSTAQPALEEERSTVRLVNHGSNLKLWHSLKLSWLWKPVITLWKSWKWPWKLEFIASIIILASPFIIVSTVLPHAGLPLPRWKLGLTINTLLSIYNVIFKACLTFVVASCVCQLQWTWFSTGHRPLYDSVRYQNAAQGFWGSLQLLWDHKIQQPLTALGVLILIVVVAIDPFIQQIVSPVNCVETLRNQTATLQRTNLVDYWSGYASWYVGDSVRMGEVASYNPSDSMSWQCWTGNCTFSEPYATLGFCNTCQDLSDAIVLNTTYGCQNAAGNSSSEISELSETACSRLGSGVAWRVVDMSTNLYLGNYSDFSGQEWLNITLDLLGHGGVIPSSHALATGFPFLPNNISNVFGVIILLGVTPDAAGKINVTNNADLTNCNTTEAQNTWSCRGYGAAACTLSPCARVYNATVSGGQLEEQVLLQSDSMGFAKNATDPIRDDSGSVPISFSIIDAQCLSQEQKGELEERGLHIDNSSRWLPFNFSTMADGFIGQYSTGGVEEWDPLIASLLSERCLYLMYQPYSTVITSALFNESLQGTVQSAWVSNDTSPTSGIANYAFWQYTGPSILLPMWNNSNMNFDGVQSVFANLSDIATAWTRAHGQPLYSAPANGTILHIATCLQVQWAWLSFPAFLALLSLVLFALVVLITNREEMPIWKNSPLVWFMRDPGVNGEATIESMEERSKDIMVTLLKSGDAKIEVIGN